MVPGTVEFQDFYGDTSVFYYVFIIIGLTEETSSNIYYCIHYSTANTVTSQYNRSIQTYSICTKFIIFFTVLLKYSIFKQISLLLSICFFKIWSGWEKGGEREEVGENKLTESLWPEPKYWSFDEIQLSPLSLLMSSRGLVFRVLSLSKKPPPTPPSSWQWSGSSHRLCDGLISVPAPLLSASGWL